MNQYAKRALPTGSTVRLPFSALLLSGLISCLMLLSACGSSVTPPQSSNKTDGNEKHGTSLSHIAITHTPLEHQTFQVAVSKQPLTARSSALKAEAVKLQQQLASEVSQWGQQHHYYDAYDDQTYTLGYEYGPNGIGGWVQDELNQAKTDADYQQTIANLQMYLTNFHAMRTNSADKTSYDNVHQTDIQLMQDYGKLGQKVMVISLQEQAMRVYDHGRLVRSFLVTTGRPELPSPPGSWWVEWKVSPITFKSPDPQGSPNWYPDTLIHYAIQYHTNGYFVHDSWWRNVYGPGTNFPHDDEGGTYAQKGSHGCVNLSQSDMAWLYNFAPMKSGIIIY